MRTESMGRAYRHLLDEVYEHGRPEVNARTGVEILALDGAHSFKLDLSEHQRLPVPGNRRYWPYVAAAEVAWQLMGTQDPEFILSTAPRVWRDFVEDGRLETAYGYRWRKHFGRDQLALAMAELRTNPTNRQLYVSAWDPSRDGLGGPQPKNIPCPVGFSLSRIGEYIHCAVFIRSSDVFVGLPYDVMGYALTVDAVAAQVGCIPGTLHVTLAHPHLYSTHVLMLNRCVGSPLHIAWTNKRVEPELPGWDVDHILEDPHGYVLRMKELANEVNHSDWDPKPELIL